MLYLTADIRHFVCANLGFVCKVLKQRGKVLEMCVIVKIVFYCPPAPVKKKCIKMYD